MVSTSIVVLATIMVLVIIVAAAIMRIYRMKFLVS